MLVRVLGTLMLIGAVAAQPQNTPTPPAVQLPNALRESVDRLADSARGIGLPTDPLYAKAAEGVLKNADTDRILDAVRRLSRELGDARSALGSTASSAELVAAASVLHAGVDVSTLRELWRIHDARRQGPSQSFVMPLVVLSDWLARRVSPAVAVASMSALLSHDSHDDEYSALRRDVERDIARGQVPDLAARVRTEALVGRASKRP